MSHTQSIIVYRNPVEQAFWESGLIFPLICAVAVAMVTAIILSKVYDALPWQYRNKAWTGHLLIVLTALSAIGTIKYMM